MENIYKVFTQNGSSLNWFSDADMFGNFIKGKHKGAIGMHLYVFMDFAAEGTKLEMHIWQHEKIINYTIIAGHRPPLNLSFY